MSFATTKLVVVPVRGRIERAITTFVLMMLPSLAVKLLRKSLTSMPSPLSRSVN
jgi:hypothetical protein